MPRRRREMAVWLPPDRTTKWTLTIAGIVVNDFLLDANLPHGLITEELIAEIELDNSGEDFTDKFKARDTIQFTMDFDDGSTIQFEGEVEEIKNRLEGGFFKLGIKGGHFTAQFLDVMVTAEFIGAAISDIKKSLITDFASDFTTTNIEDNLKTIDIKFVNKPLLDCLIELDIQGDEDTYIDFNKDVHSFKKQSKINDNEAVVWDDSLITLRGLGTDSAEVRNKITVYGEAGGLPVISTSEDNTSQETFRTKEKVITDTSIVDEDVAQVTGDAEKALLKNPESLGSADCLFMPSLNPGDMIHVISPPQKLHDRFRLVKFVFHIPNETMEVFFNKERSIPKLLKDRIRKDLAQETIVNPSNMLHSYNFTFNNENKIDSVASSGFVVENSIVRKDTSVETGFVFSLKKDTPITVTSVRILAVGETLDGATYHVRADSSAKFQSITLDTETDIKNKGTELVLQIKITNNDTRIDAIAVLYK